MRIWKSKYFYGNKISDYGLEQGYLDYGTLAKAFDAVLCNDITNIFEMYDPGTQSEAEQINGIIDNSDEIDELEERIAELDEEFNAEEIEELEERIVELRDEEDTYHEIFQYYIISANGAEILKEFTDDPVFYVPFIDCYVWGVTHYGTSWDYVLTDVKLELEEE